jgi:hypothetical protein
LIKFCGFVGFSISAPWREGKGAAAISRTSKSAIAATSVDLARLSVMTASTQSRKVTRQQPEGDGAPSAVVMPTAMPGVAKLEVSIIGVSPHVVTETTGGATVISGLRPGAVAPDGTVASLKSGAATVLGVSRGTGLPTRELVCVGSAVIAREAASVMVAVGLQMLKVVAMPNGVVIGSGATKDGGLTGGLGPMEDDDDDGNMDEDGDGDAKSPVVGAAFAAAAVAGPMIPVVGHIAIAPSDVPGNGPNTPRLS